MKTSRLEQSQESISIPFTGLGSLYDVTWPDRENSDLTIDLNDFVNKNPTASYFVRVSGASMSGAGIHDNDILLIDRTLDANNGDIIVAAINGEFTVKEVRFHPLRLIPHNPTFKTIHVSEADNYELFGVVSCVIRRLK
ncbi:MAG: hypothetical protein CML21_00385 [Rheinheimera sp.]|nr:hypothetical protein [Rheinheimera sp.]|tara:strand:+ start:2643 stop:3059 length:417 start_codon:yes stop_codon:yes gene_type:complete